MIFYRIEQQNKQDIIQNTYLSSANQLASDISLYLQVKDISSINRAISHSYLAQNANLVQVLDETGSVFLSSNSNFQLMSCSDQAGNVSVTYNKVPIGQIAFCYDPTRHFNNSLPTALILSLVIAMIALIGSIYLLFRFQTKQIRNFISRIDQIDPNAPSFEVGSAQIGDKDINALYTKMSLLITNLQNAQKENNENQKRMAIANMAKQVAHNIRSPLAALQSVLSNNISSLSESDRMLVKKSSIRIEEIACELLDSVKSEQNQGTQTCLLSSVITDCVALKRSQYYQKRNIEIISEIEDDAHFLFARINLKEFHKVISNLVNNAVDALTDKADGRIEVRLAKLNDKSLLVTVADNGHGIPSEIIERVTEDGFSFGKKQSGSGTGQGLHHAKMYIHGIGGTLKIKSNEDGTKIILSLPVSSAPNWFESKINLQDIKSVVVLDDDASIHEVWKQRFSEHSEITLFHFTKSCDFWNWYNANGAVVSESLFLCDYELIGENTNGLEIIKNADQLKSSYLVTSNYDDEKVLKNLGALKMIPKSHAHLVELLTDAPPKKNVQYVLIDDEELNHFVWKESAKTKGTNLTTYFTIDDFLNDKDRFSKDAMIYVDSNLGNGVKGEIESKRIYDEGFGNIVIATGYEPKNIPKQKWFSSVSTKIFLNNNRQI